MSNLVYDQNTIGRKGKMAFGNWLAKPRLPHSPQTVNTCPHMSMAMSFTPLVSHLPGEIKVVFSPSIPHLQDPIRFSLLQAHPAWRICRAIGN
ncbi:hypothetical protein L1887_36794 [Cichorium endivia]|nr:hypothetical protein L1887_36794 [Cichorium endivia]